MFTGLIQDVGKVESLHKNREGILISVKSNKICNGLNLGDSIAINGVCQTVTHFTHNVFQVQAVHTTLEKTNFCDLKNGDFVNLEPALRFSDRLGGHLVQGHVNGTCKVVKIENIGKNYNLSFSCEQDLLRYMIKEGSICLNGISLTISDLNKSSNIFQVTIIPHTWVSTVLQFIKVGSVINVEVDLIAKYVENFFKIDQKPTLTPEWLKERGF